MKVFLVYLTTLGMLTEIVTETAIETGKYSVFPDHH